VLAVDILPGSVAVARANVEANGLGDRVEVRQGSLEVVGADAFDIVVANLLAHILVKLLGEGLDKVVAPGGALIMSGIEDDEDVTDVRRALAARGLSPAEEQRLGGWVTMVVRPGGATADHAADSPVTERPGSSDKDARL
jgi:ribosomal protein L11 methyltransferase